MARKQEPTKPLLAVKGDFVSALERVMHESLMLTQAVDMAIQDGQMSNAARDVLRERVTAFKKAIFTTEND